ncbi:NAD-dependent epimerase/dehydratase family protein [Desertimonas flava]|jgi:UDP-glucose 4-epimerase|uniref:NAD-dependent epimerase/dehydratase family protein n=1 Tax=Desertimonas flava TaxID=2064846 RepID=UPI000E3476FA|nr:NAD-dependent epimerase/dehydratase family protein [Desertimonas flava]
MSESPNRPAEDPPADASRSGGRPPAEVLVIGGAGFIGSHLVERLLAAAVSVDVIDDLSSGSLANLSSARETARINGGDLRIHTIDASAPEVRDLVTLRRPKHIFHLALLPPGRTDPTALGRSFTSTLTVLEAARQASVSKVVVLLPATAMHGYPSSRDLPAKEGEIVPRGVRGVVAKAIVDLLTLYREQHGIEFTALAASSVYGPRQHPKRGVVAALIDAASRGEPARLTGDGRQSRDFVYVDDVVDALIRTRERGSGLVVNVGTGVQTTLRDLAAIVARSGPAPTFVAARPDELARFSVSPVRARIHLGWASWTLLPDGITATRNPPTD